MKKFIHNGDKYTNIKEETQQKCAKSIWWRKLKL